MEWSCQIALWNANGLIQHRLEIILFLQIHNIDVMLISETHFTDKSYLNIPGYVIYDTQHPDGTAHGGTAIIIRNNLKHHVLPEYKTDCIQATSIMLGDVYGSMALTAVYCPPKHRILQNEFTIFLKSIATRFIVGGDFNAKHIHWGSRLNNPRGSELYKTVNELNIKTISTGEPTYWPTDINKIPDLLDFFIIKGIPIEKLKVVNNYDLSSDHSPVLMTCSSSVIRHSVPPKLSNNLTNWELFREILNENLSVRMPLSNCKEIDEAVEHLTRSIQEAAWKSTPLNNTTRKCNFPITIRAKLEEKRRLRRIWQNSRQPEDKRLFNRASRQLSRQLKLHKNESFSEYVQSLSPTTATNYSLWKATRRFKRPQPHIPPIRNTDNTWARSGKEKAERFGEHFSSVFQPVPQRSPFEENINNYLDVPLQLSPPIQPFSPTDIKETIIKHTNPNKSPGYDLITGKIIRELPKKGYAFIASIFNSIITCSHFPSQWKIAQIIAILKPGKPINEATSYRPISLLPIISKVFEKLILQKLKPLLLEIIPDFQFGFREGHSTIEQVHRVVDIIQRDFESRRYCSAAFIDIQQAFDKVWHVGLLYKIKLLLPHPYYLLIKSYLSDRYFQVKYKDELSSFQPIKSGVPQGSVLGPILYLIYTYDLPVTENTIIATFADDTAILASHECPRQASQYLQFHLDQLQEWFNKWRIIANSSKSQHITFTLCKENSPKIYLNGEELLQVKSIKYLGLHLDEHLTWKDHITTKKKQAKLKFSQLNWLLNRKSELSIENKLLIYKTVIRPIWTYGMQLWGSASNSNIEILRRFESQSLRIIANAPWFVSNYTLQRDLEIPTIREDISKFSSRHQAKINRHQNPLAINLLDNSETTYRLKRHHVLDLTFRFSQED